MISFKARAIAGVGLAILMVAAAIPAYATPIIFTFSATHVSGALGTTAITDQTLVVTASADTTDLTICNGNTPNYSSACFTGGILTGNFAVGSSAGTFTDLLYVFNNQGNQAVGFGTGTTADLLDLFTSGLGLATYGLASSFGPITVASPNWTWLNGVSSVSTNLGGLSLNGNADSMLGFQAVTHVAVPEPNVLGLFGLGLLMIGALGWGFRKRQPHPQG